MDIYTLYALYATLFTWGLTILGSSMVFFFKKINKNVMDISLGLAAGIMMSASFFSLLNPAITSALNNHQKPYIIVSLGFIIGGLFIYLADITFNHYLSKNNLGNKRLWLMILSITLHNIPEGLAVGIAFGSVRYGLNDITLLNASLLALAIGLQNFPEGSAISLPLRREKWSLSKSFIYGSLSAIVEPIFGIIGAILTLKLNTLMPLFLSFAAGAMIYVIVEELIPESQTNKNKSLMAIMTLIGFIIMMILDISL